MGIDNQQISWTLTAIDRASGVFKTVETGMAGLERAWGGIQRVIAGGIAADFVLKMVEQTKEAEQAATRLQAVLRNTGATAGFTREELDGFAEALAKSTQFDDDGIRKAEAALLIFGKIQGQTFRDALKLSTDLAAFWGTDLPSAARDVAKALAEPETAFKLLKSAGVTLSDQQKDQIKHMGALGDTAGQQRVVLELLQKAYHGVAEEMNTGFTKATTGASKAWDDLLKALGHTSTVQTSVQSFFGFLTQSSKDLKEIVENGDWVEKLLALAAFSAGFRDLKLTPQGRAGSRSASGKIGGLEAGSPGGLTDAEYAAQKIARLQAFGISEINLGSQRDAASAELKILEDTHKDGLVSEEQYYADRRKLIEQNLKVELAAVEAGKAAQAAILERGGTKEEIAAAQLAYRKLNAQGDKARLTANTDETLLAAQKRRDELARGAESAKALGETYTQLGERVAVADQSLADFNETRSLDDQALKLQTDLLTKSGYEQGLLTKNREIDLQTQAQVNKLGVDQIDQMAELYAAGERAKVQAKELYDANYAAAKSWQTGVIRALDTYFEEVTNNAKQMETLVADAFHGMEDALVSFVKTGKLDFRSLADSIITDMIRIQIQNSIMKPLTTYAQSSGGLFGGLANLLGIGGGAQTNVQTSAGSVSAAEGFASGYIPMAAGGDFMVTKPTLFLAGEAGPERATFSGAGRAGMAGGGGGGHVFNVDMRGASVEAVQRLERFVAGVNGSIEQRAIGAALDHRRRYPNAWGV